MLLTAEEKQKAFLLHGKSYEALCDEPECGRLIKMGELCVVVKWKTYRAGEQQIVLGPRPKKIRCMVCDDRIHGRVELREKMAHKEAKHKKKMGDIIPEVRKRIIRIFTKDSTPIDADVLILRIRKKEEFKSYKKNQLKKVFRAMKKIKELQRRDKLWSLVTKEDKDAAKAKRGTKDKKRVKDSKRSK